MTAQHPSLAGAFATHSPRGDALRGLLPPRPPSPPVAVEQPAPVVDEPKAARPRREKATAVAVAERIVNMPVYLPPGLLTYTRDEIRRREITYGDLLFDAFESVDTEALSAAFVPTVQATASGVPRRALKVRGDAGIQRQFRVSEAQRDWVDAKVLETGASSRSALCAEVIRLYRSRQQSLAS
jgi:hypothetical protein